MEPTEWRSDHRRHHVDRDRVDDAAMEPTEQRSDHRLIEVTTTGACTPQWSPGQRSEHEPRERERHPARAAAMEPTEERPEHHSDLLVEHPSLPSAMEPTGQRSDRRNLAMTRPLIVSAAMEPTGQRSDRLVPWLMIRVSASPQWSRPDNGRMCNWQPSAIISIQVSRIEKCRSAVCRPPGK
jgi:hypothetical protein